MLTEQLFKEKPVPGGFGSTVSISEQGRNWYDKNKNLTKPSMMIQPNAALAPFLHYTKTVSKNGKQSTHTAVIKSPTQPTSST